MSKYYFFNSSSKILKMMIWFYNELDNIAYLSSISPVVFRIENITYVVEYNEETKKIFCSRLYDEELIKFSHKLIIEKIESYLNNLKGNVLNGVTSNKYT